MKSKTFFLYLGAWIIALTIGLYFRLYPLYSFSTDASDNKAALLVIGQLKRQVEQQVQSTQPDLTPKARKQIVKKLLNELIHKEREQVRTTITKVSKNLDDKTQSTKQSPYLLASDSYYYYQLTENLIETGKIAKTKKGSKYLNTLMLAPEGHWEPFNLHPYVGKLVYDVMNFFDEGIDRMYALSYTPLLLTAIALAFFFLNGYLLGCQFHHTFIASIFFLCAPIFVRRSMFGWYDNDPYNTLFPLAILSCLFFASKTLNKHKSLIAYSITALLMCLYAHFWQGWVFLFVIIMVALLINCGFQLLFRRSETNVSTATLPLLIVFIGSFIFISLTFGTKEFFKLFQEGWIALTNFLNPQLSPWPDLYISVSELHSSSLSEIIALTGGAVIFTLAIFGLSILLLNILRKDKDTPPMTGITLILFFAVSIFISLGAQRFTLLILTPMGLLCALGIRYGNDYFNKVFSEVLKNQTYRSIVTGTLLSALIIIPIHSTKNAVANLINPLFNQTWEKVLTDIRDNTPQNSIVNSWWSPGHFIKAIAKRKVTFDGATINVPQAYWMSNFFLSKSENEGLGILRMMNNSGNKASEYLQTQGLKLSTTIGLLKQITAKNNFHARMLLTVVLKDEEKINKLLSFTHNTPPPSYILIYNEFVDKNLQLSFIGNWNFKAIENINQNPELLANVPKHNSSEYVDFLWEMAGGQHKYSPPLEAVAENGELMLFEDNLTINKSSFQTEINSPTYGQGIPYSIFYATKNDVIEKKQLNATLPYSVVLYQNGTNKTARLMDRDIAQSMLIRLFVFNGKGLKYIKPFTASADLTKRTSIKVFEINWKELMTDGQKL